MRPGRPGSPERAPRLASLDALRGFDMLWIVGGRTWLVGLAGATGWSWLHAAVEQTEHAPWHGFTLWDGIFPLFLFLAGVSTPLSFAARRARGATTGDLLAHIARRAAWLVLLGAVYNGLLRFDLAEQRWASVLGRIGLAWAAAACITLATGVRGRVLWSAGLLLGAWAALAWIPVPGIGAGALEPGRTFGDWVDRTLVPGRLHRGDRDPEGAFGLITATATALLGGLAGEWLRGGPREARRSLALAGAGLAALALGALWSTVLPLNKNLWSSSFVLWTAGGGALLLAAFHGVLDVHAAGGARRWHAPLSLLGRNALAAYMLGRFVDFEGLALLVVGPAERLLHPGLLAGGELLFTLLAVFALERVRGRATRDRNRVESGDGLALR